MHPVDIVGRALVGLTIAFAITIIYLEFKNEEIVEGQVLGSRATSRANPSPRVRCITPDNLNVPYGSEEE